MSGDVHVRFCESRGVRFPPATHLHLISDVVLAGHRVDATVLLAALVAWVVAYMAYKMFWHADFGLPVRRRLLAREMRVERDQVAFVPLWWSDLQIQHAVSAHWRNTLRATVKGGPEKR